LLLEFHVKRSPWLVLIALAILAPVLARGADVTITCAPPTQFTDNTPIPATAVMTFKLYSGSTALDTQPACKFVRTGLAPNTYNYTATATVAGVESDQSAPAQVVVPAPKPKPPGTPTATIAVMGPTAYSMLKSTDQVVLIPVGTIPIGTACDSNQGVIRDGKAFNLVTAAAVTWTGSVRSIAVVASCG
jgi:hypothetical protein